MTPDPVQITRLPATPPWRPFAQSQQPAIAPVFSDADRLWDPDDEVQLAARARRYWIDATAPQHREYLNTINAALYLRRPLLLRGDPGVGKSSLAYAIAYELALGPVLYWPITSRSTLQDGLYRYDALARLQESTTQGTPAPIGDFIQLGPVGQAFVTASRPRVLLIDELDKSDLDFPNDLLHLFEEGQFTIPELARVAQQEAAISVFDQRSRRRVPIHEGRVRCQMFPIILMTDNGERTLPPAFLRRCVRLEIKAPGDTQLTEMVHTALGHGLQADMLTPLLQAFRTNQPAAIDQLLNAAYMLGLVSEETDRTTLTTTLMRSLNER